MGKRRQFGLGELIFVTNVLGIAVAILFFVIRANPEIVNELPSLLFSVSLPLIYLGGVGTFTSVLLMFWVWITPDSSSMSKREFMRTSRKFLYYSLVLAVAAPAVLILFSMAIATAVSFLSPMPF